jgi:asparagine synthase (glutamine-hydrolysing)
LVEFVFSLPSSYKIREVWTKAILRFSLSDILPPEIVWRKEKVGFEPPNYKTVPTEEIKWAIDRLVEKKVLDIHHIIPEKSWEYVQVAHLYEN